MTVSGIKEWAEHSVNCSTGCSHDCRYCYARAMAARFGRATRDTWSEERVRQDEVDKPRRRLAGRIMFPTTHDITPALLAPCLGVLGKILEAGNRVLIVSKPHADCMERVFDLAGPHVDRVMFRFTIGGMSDAVLAYWEPGAPRFHERLHCLRRAHALGFETSVSAEPLVEADRVDELVAELLPCITDALWIGKMNKITSRVRVLNEEDARRVAAIRAGQTEGRVRALYRRYAGNPRIRWKESIKKVVGLPCHEVAGVDR